MSEQRAKHGEEAVGLVDDAQSASGQQVRTGNSEPGEFSYEAG